MKKYRLQIGLDVDDILYDCNAYALELLNREEGITPPLSIYDIRSWGGGKGKADDRLRYFAQPDFVASQPILPGAKEFVAQLCEVADVFFVSAVPPACMSARAMRLTQDFPEVPIKNILLGQRKDLVQLDILLDDGAHNISHSPATYPVLFRKPWNMHLSGLLSVTGFNDFVHLVDMLRHSYTESRPDLREGGVICLVGPTGSGKNEVARALVEQYGMKKPITATTRPPREDEDASHYRFVSDREFLAAAERGEYLETTVYGGYHYGTFAGEIDRVVASGGVAVLPIDICGALSLKNRYRHKALTVFLKRRREDVIFDIVSRALDARDKTCRILSLDDEYRNEELCDLAMDVKGDIGALAAQIAKAISAGPITFE